MKKILALLAAMALSCTMLASCGDEDSSTKDTDSSTASVADTTSAADDTSSEADASSEDDTSSKADEPANNGGSVAAKLSADAKIENITEKQTEDKLFEKLVNEITTNKTCTMDYELSQEGMNMIAVISMDADNVYMDMDVLGMKMTAFISPDGSYYIDKETKKYYKAPAGEEADTEELGLSLVDEMSSLEGMEYVSTADCEIDGKAYVLETWKNTELGTEMQYVFDGEDVVLVKQEDVQMPFLLSAKADESLFTLDGLTEMTDEEFAAYQEALMGSMGGALGEDATDGEDSTDDDTAGDLHAGAATT